MPRKVLLWKHQIDEVTDPSHFSELKDLPEAGEEELSVTAEIVDKMTEGPGP